MSGPATSGPSTDLAFVADRAQLQREWCDLEQRSESSFFTSWSWLGCWLETLPPRIQPLRLRTILDGRVIGLGLLVAHRQWRHGFVLSRSLNLHTTGEPQFDTLTICRNGFLVDREHAAVATKALFEHLIRAEPGWNELRIDAVVDTAAAAVPTARGLRQLGHSATSHFADLDAVRARKGDYLALLSAKTRSRVRRSVKEYSAFGPLTVRVAASVGESLEMLDGLQELHQDYWRKRGQPGSYANPFFLDFHRRLIKNCFDRGEIQMMTVDVGDRRIAYLQNFLYRQHVYAYQCGFDYTICANANLNRPGLVAHSAAIEHNAHLGQVVYDFLTGDYRYKQELGTGSVELRWVVLQRENALFQLEDLLRRYKGAWFSRRPAAEAPEPSDA